VPYKQGSPPKSVNIIEFDCRGLEFVEFKADVSYGLRFFGYTFGYSICLWVCWEI
jgi:hypothetical protein